MAYKILGQAIPAANNVTGLLYTVPGGLNTITSSLMICNQGAGTTFRVSVQIAGAALTGKQYLSYDTYVDANLSIPIIIGMTLNENDTVTVSSLSGLVSFNLFGTEG
jgi:hypothetical protein